MCVWRGLCVLNYTHVHNRAVPSSKLQTHRTNTEVTFVQVHNMCLMIWQQIPQPLAGISFDTSQLWRFWACETLSQRTWTAIQAHIHPDNQAKTSIRFDMFVRLKNIWIFIWNKLWNHHDSSKIGDLGGFYSKTCTSLTVSPFDGSNTRRIPILSDNMPMKNYVQTEIELENVQKSPTSLPFAAYFPHQQP